MSANIDHSTGRTAFVFTGDRNSIWHRMGQTADADMTVAQWAERARFFNVSQRDVYFDLPDGTKVRADEYSLNVRDDTNAPLGMTRKGYKLVQPIETLEFFDGYIAADDRFKRDTAGSLVNGKMVFATAIFNGPSTVAGDKHVNRLLMTTTFDGSQATRCQGTTVRVVCDNTRRMAQGEHAPVISVRHNTRFDHDKARAQLAKVVQGFESYRLMGDAMAEVSFKRDAVVKYFKKLLEIPWEAKKEDISARKMNQYADLWRAYQATTREGTPGDTAWTAYNAVTRYVDHDRSSRGGTNPTEARFVSAQFGSGDRMKEQATSLLYAMSEGELERIIKGATRPAGSDFSEAEFANVLRGAIRPS